MTRLQPGPVLIMAGGTGGHIFPGIAVARVLQAQSVPVVWLGTEAGLERRLVPEAGLPLETLAMSGLRGKRLTTLLGAPFMLLRAVWQAIAVIRRHRPRSVLSMGGYAAAPGGIAAWLLRRPLLVHEQNSVPGMTNRLLARFARRVLCGFPGAFPAARKAEPVGNPVRSQIAALPPPGERFAGREGPIRLLVLGGSQGARALNRALPEALAALPSGRLAVRHQCGAKWLEETRADYAAGSLEVEVEPFIADMAAAYAWADLVLCRAGALTLAELAAAGVGALLVPLPAATDDHQTRNAQFMVAAGAARLLAEGPQFADRLFAALHGLTAERGELLAMAEAAARLARRDAAERVASACLEESRE
jgi:UDP-N-acetylglucosamine--N-acetylmuramyl-(pentapeptide) pyrophosphoryl-undecaprenol N-acetylglucosamine transferase